MGDITYRNKDVASKMTAESMVGESLSIFGLPDLKVVRLLPTNLPVIECNELYMDNLFLLEDGSVAIVDYESVLSKENFVKYMNYIARVVRRYSMQKQLGELKQIRVLVIYTADIEHAEEVYDLGDMILRIEASYLVKLDTDAIYQQLTSKICTGERLSWKELSQLMFLPLTVKGEKRKYIDKTVELIRKIQDQTQRKTAMSGLIVFTDKVIDESYSSILGREYASMITKAEKKMWDGQYEAGRRKGEKTGLKKGLRKGLRKGIRILLESCRDMGATSEFALQQLIKLYELPEEEAKEYLDQFWNTKQEPL